MGSRRKGEPWYYGYLRDQITRIWGWSPERRKALNRARWPGPHKAGQETWKCEECGAGPLDRKERDVDHVAPRENVNGWDGWGPYIARALDVKAEALLVKCKPCHHKKSAAENATRRSRKKNGRIHDT